jgi:hypothetical protein
MPRTVFISYSHSDKRWKDLLSGQLGVLETEGLLAAWHDGHIQPGAEWLPEIQAAMAEARVAIFIVSAEFLNSAFIRRKEITALMERRQREGLRVIPVIARPCPWQKVSWLAAIQAQPLGGKTLAELGGVKAERVLSGLADQILGFVESQEPPPTPGRMQATRGASAPAVAQEVGIYLRKQEIGSRATGLATFSKPADQGTTIEQATQEYERWLASFVDIVPEDLAVKHRRTEWRTLVSVSLCQTITGRRPVCSCGR